MLPRNAAGILARKASNDVVILSALRTPVCRAYKGGLRSTYPEELLATVLRATLEANPNLPPARIQDVCTGTVLSDLGGSKAARAALCSVPGFNAEDTTLYTINRACASSLQSISAIAGQIATGAIDAGIAAGMESMTRNYGSGAIPPGAWPELKDSEIQQARDCFLPMGITSENVASRYNISRNDQDVFAAESHTRAAKSREQGFFDEEIVPVVTKDGEGHLSTITEDDGIRPGTTVDSLSKLKPVFSPLGASTAGNSSQVSDGAAAVLLMRRSAAKELGLGQFIIGRFVGSTTVGTQPDEMGVGPAFAIPPLLKRLGLEANDVDRWEINEAFASQCVYSIRKLGLVQAWIDGKVNPDGGAIALGHPLGATGARLVSTLIHGLGRTGGEVGVISMCVGTGMGAASAFIRE